VGPGRLQWRPDARSPGQERHPEHPPDPRGRTAGVAPAPAREPVVTFVFVSERGSPFTTAGFARMIERAATAAGLELKAPHMLRHACGYALANKGHDTRAIQGWLGHRSITGTAVYTTPAPNWFKDFWREDLTYRPSDGKSAVRPPRRRGMAAEHELEQPNNPRHRRLVSEDKLEVGNSGSTNRSSNHASPRNRASSAPVDSLSR
jgi:Phage integrase family